jgi:hypothetical protein
MANVRGIIKSTKSVLDNVLDELEPPKGPTAADKAFVAKAKAQDPLDGLLDEIEGKGASSEEKSLIQQWTTVDTSTPDTPANDYSGLLDDILDEVDQPLPVPEVEELSAFSDEAELFNKTPQVFNDLSDPTQAYYYLLSQDGVTSQGLSKFTPDELAELAMKHKTGLLSPDEVLQKVELSPEEVVNSLLKDLDVGYNNSMSLENKAEQAVIHGQIFNNTQLPFILEPEDKSKLVKIATTMFEDEDRLNVELAKLADFKPSQYEPLYGPEGFAPGTPEREFRDSVDRVFTAVRGTSLAPSRMRDKVERNVRFLEGSVGMDPMEKASAEAIQKLPLMEVAGLHFYTNRGDKAMNWALRWGEVEPGSALDNTIKFVSDTLDKLPAYKAPIYRGVSNNRWDDYQIGEVYQEPGFSSFTRQPLGRTLAQIEDEEIEALKKPMRTTLIVQSKSGKLIEAASDFVDELEVLYKPGAKFRVVDKDEDTMQILLEEVE